MNDFEVTFKDGTKLEFKAPLTAADVDRQVAMARSEGRMLMFDLEDADLYVLATEIIAFRVTKAPAPRFEAKVTRGGRGKEQVDG